MDVNLFLQLYGINRKRAAHSLHLSESAFNRRLREGKFTKAERQKLFELCRKKQTSKGVVK